MNSLSVAALLLVAACASAQYRPFYAGGGVQYPRPINTNGNDAGDGLGNRGGFDAPSVSTRDQFGHDTKLVEEASNLPRDVQPFWIRNREQILRHIGLNAPVPAGGVVGTQPAAVVETTSGFSGPSQPSVSAVDSAANLA